jgi:hypothetical protein
LYVTKCMSGSVTHMPIADQECHQETIGFGCDSYNEPITQGL